MNRSLRLLTVLPVLSILAASTARAQSGNMSFNIAAGLSLASGNYGDRNDAGYSVIAGVGLSQPVSPLAFRLEVMYNEFDEKFGGGKSKAGGLTGNAIYQFSTGPTAQFKLYGIGGIGYYSTREPSFDFESQTNFGWNIGGGIKMPLSGFTAYVEARFHSVSNVDTQFVPIVFGLIF